MKNVSEVYTKFDYLRMAESRQFVVGIDFPESSENVRLEFVIYDLKSKMTDEELVEYDRRKNAVQTAAEKEIARKAMIKAMNENREKTSI